MNKKIEKALRKILTELKELEPYIYHKSYTTNSVYVKFKNERLRSLRISDHDGYDKYKYKWNIRSDVNKMYVDNDNNIKRFYYPLSDFGISWFIKTILKGAKIINANTANVKDIIGILEKPE